MANVIIKDDARRAHEAFVLGSFPYAVLSSVCCHII